MNRICSTCEYYSEGVPEELRRRHAGTNTGTWATGVCLHTFPKTYRGQLDPPHITMVSSRCFEWAERRLP